jgi:chemotaxis protein CheC
MKVDIDALGLFNRLAGEGARSAATALGRLSGVDIYVDVTGVSLLTETDMREAFVGGDHVGVSIGLAGGLSGETVLAFDRESIDRLLDVVLPGRESGTFDAMDRSGVKEVGNIAVGGFVDGWANHLGTAIDLTPPTYLEAIDESILPAGDTGSAVFLFESTLRAHGADMEFSILMLPEYDGFARLLAARPGGDAGVVSLDRLSAFDRIARQGATGAAQHLTTMTGLETELEVSKLRFVPVETVPACVGDHVVAGTVFGLNEGRDGYLAVLFDEESALAVADSMLPEGMGGDGEFDSMTESVLKEVGNVMTSGFIDGWANVLGTSIEHTPPEFVHDMGTAVLDPVVNRIAVEQDHAFVVDTAMRTDGREFGCDVFALPDGRRLTGALGAMDVTEADATG